MIAINDEWYFVSEFSDDFLQGKVEGEKIRIPHNVRELPLHYADKSSYELISGYKRIIHIPAEASNKRVFLQFDGAAHIATVYINRKEVYTHYCGYTAFRIEITDYIADGDLEVCVKLDSSENPAIPPFGFVIDYLTYGGIYREVWLDICDKEYIDDIFIRTPALDEVKITVSDNADKERELVYEISDDRGRIIASKTTCEREVNIKAENIVSWSPDQPVLYNCRVAYTDGSGARSVRFGFRTIGFTADEFLLNGKPFFIRGLNRHQCYPYIGYAATASLQREDARILKEELQCNAVRTSHYPQSQHFIDACDELGLLVFTEIPGWQHVGDLDWQKIAINNTEEMVKQYRNHPSIYMWGVRINESQDHDEFYTTTNAVAHKLDDSRPTSGVRFLQKSHLLEDVYSFNDFSHCGNNPGVLPKDRVTPDINKPLIISEANGHMFPTKPFDDFHHRQEQALRHARVVNDAKADRRHIGVYTWCMFDYATHEDFGSGDRICYHGVLDSFRNPKLAAAVYAMQGEEPVLEVGSSMAIGDYPAGMINPIYVFSNADTVKLYKNDQFVTELPESEYQALNHGPRLLDDIVGHLLESNEGYSGEKEILLRKTLNEAGNCGIDTPSQKVKEMLDELNERYQIGFDEVRRLFGKYIGNWGGEAISWRFDGVKDGKVIASRTFRPSAKLHLEADCSSLVLKEGDTYDMVMIRIRILDENNNLAPYGQLPLSFETQGEIELCGPNLACAEGGMSGTFIRTAGKKGSGKLVINCLGLDTLTLEFEVR